MLSSPSSHHQDSERGSETLCGVLCCAVVLCCCAVVNSTVAVLHFSYAPCFVYMVYILLICFVYLVFIVLRMCDTYVCMCAYVCCCVQVVHSLTLFQSGPYDNTTWANPGTTTSPHHLTSDAADFILSPTLFLFVYDEGWLRGAVFTYL